jgi:hypothetical protein
MYPYLHILTLYIFVVYCEPFCPLSSIPCALLSIPSSVLCLYFPLRSSAYYLLSPCPSIYFFNFFPFVRCVLLYLLNLSPPPPPTILQVSVHFIFCSYVLPSILSSSLYSSFFSFLYAVSLFYSHYPFHLHYPFCPLRVSIFTCSLYPAMFLCYAMYPIIYPSVLCSSMFLVAIPSLQFFPFSPFISFLCVLAVTLVSCNTSIKLSFSL